MNNEQVLVYLRASTDDQNAERAKGAIDNFLDGFGLSALPQNVYSENISGTKLDRPELNKLINSARTGDVLVIEQVDRLSRLTSNDWKKLKGKIESKGIHIVSLDLPTSHLILNQSSNMKNSLVGDILGHVNNLLLEILATTARKDFEDRRRRQEEGIAKAKADGKYKGRPVSQKNIAAYHRSIELQKNNGLSMKDACKVASISVPTYYRLKKSVPLMNND